MKPRATSLLAAGIVGAVTFVALVAQITLLGGMGTGGGSAAASKLILAPAVNAQLLGNSASSPIKFDASRNAAVAQVRGLNIAASDVLAVSLGADEVTANMRLSLGWLSTQNLSRPANASAALSASNDSQANVVLLSGHPRWRENVTQIALGFERVGASEVAPGAVITNVELIPANPLGAMRLLSMAWFSVDGNILTPNESANRLLPLALWLALICAASVAITALIFRSDPADRAAAMKAVAIALTLLALAATVLANRWPGWSVPIGAGIAAVIALLLIAAPRALALTRSLTLMQQGSLALVALGVCVVLSPWVAAVALIPAILLGLTHLPASRALPVNRIVAGLAAVPVLLMAAMSQGLLAAPALLTPLADPTRALANVVAGAGGLPGLALGMLAMHQMWPAPAQAPRWSAGALVASLWALVGALFVLAVPKIAVSVQGSSTYIALFFPLLTCLGLALLPKFKEIAQSLAETQVSEAKTEADLSVQALALLESHAERVQTTLARREFGSSRTALKQMQRIAPAAHATYLAQLRLALAEGDLVAADLAAAQVGASRNLTATDRDALLELAHRQGKRARVIELAMDASSTEGNQRALAMARLIDDGAAAAIATLSDWPNERAFARELAELHLLNDDVPAAQKALVNSGVALTEPTGQAYIARLGMRVQGPAPHAQSIGSLALWHPQLGTAQAAQGELLLHQGNGAGARARFLLAMKLDTSLWPLQKRLADVDAAVPVPPAASQ